MEILPNTPEWLEARKKYITATDAPIIMGDSPWSTPYKLWMQKLDLEDPTPVTKRMRDGAMSEERARLLFEKETGLLVFPKFVVSKKHSWMAASLDGITLDGSVFVEIKAPGKQDHECALRGEIPKKYFPQVQHQLATTDLKEAYYFSYTSTSTALLTVPRDDKYIQELISKEKEFYDRIVNFDPPPIQDEDYLERDDPDWERACKDYIEAKELADFWKQKEYDARNNLIRLSDGNSIRGCGLKLNKIIKKGVVDYASIPEIAFVDLEKYRKPANESWRISVNTQIRFA